MEDGDAGGLREMLLALQAKVVTSKLKDKEYEKNAENSCVIQ